MLDLALLPAETLSYVLGYLVVGLTNITAEYLILRMVFPARRPPLLWFAYFLVKDVGDALLWYVQLAETSIPSVELLNAVWSYVTGILSFAVVYYSFASDLVSIGVCAFTCDLFAGITVSAAAMLSNVAWGLPLTIGYLRPIGLPTLCECIISAVAYLCLSRPISWLLRWLCLMARCNRMAWGLAMACLISFFVAMTQQLTASTSLASHLPVILPFAFAVVLTLGLLLALRAREAHQRERMVRECAELASSYDHTVRAQLEEVERDLVALDGHELVLGALESKDERVAKHVHDLRHAYVHLCAGVYCDRPALDAVLTTGARRLRSLGVSPTFTVAAVSVRTVVPATVCLAPLNLAGEAAERTNGVDGETVELRIRGIGDQVLFRLDVPERWGALWARRFLMTYDTTGTKLVRERRQGERRVVLVVSEGVVS